MRAAGARSGTRPGRRRAAGTSATAASPCSAPRVYVETPDCQLRGARHPRPARRSGERRSAISISSTTPPPHRSSSGITSSSASAATTSTSPATSSRTIPETGARQWRWYTHPEPGTPEAKTWPSVEAMMHGGGMTWGSTTYDPRAELDLLRHRQPAAGDQRTQAAGRQPLHRVDRRAESRHGTARVVLPVVAARHARLGRDADAGALRRHDRRRSRGSCWRRPARNGWFFVLDRETGRNISSSEYVKTNWAHGVDAKGQPIPNPRKEPQVDGALVSPNQGGGQNWPPPSFSPQTGLFYVNATRAFSVYYLYENENDEKPQGWGGNDRGGWSEAMLQASTTGPASRLALTSGKAVPARPIRPAVARRATCSLPATRRTTSSPSTRHGRPAVARRPARVDHQWADHVPARRHPVRRRRCRRQPLHVRITRLAHDSVGRVWRIASACRKHGWSTGPPACNGSPRITVCTAKVAWPAKPRKANAHHPSAIVPSVARWLSRPRRRHNDLGYTDTPMLPGLPYRVHDPARPHPPLVTPAAQSGGRHPTPSCSSPVRTYRSGRREPAVEGGERLCRGRAERRQSDVEGHVRRRAAARGVGRPVQSSAARARIAVTAASFSRDVTRSRCSTRSRIPPTPTARLERSTDNGHRW